MIRLAQHADGTRSPKLQERDETVRRAPGGAPPARLQANSPELLIQLARAGAGITAVPDYFALPWVRQGGLRRILPTWSLPSHTAWAVFPGRRLMPAKTRAFIDMLQMALGGTG